MSYLTSVPPLQDGDLGFVLIIDRRNDKWTSVKTAFVRIANFFPGLISAVYVLRPTSFLQKAISEVSCKVFKDEFKFKVVVCAGDSELHEHVDRDQLTEDLGGTASYCHDAWLEQRIALERFSASTHEIGTALRGFTQRLQEVELPSDVAQAQEQLAIQAAEYAVLKDDLLSATRHGESLLACIRKSNANANAQSCSDGREPANPDTSKSSALKSSPAIKDRGLSKPDQHMNGHGTDIAVGSGYSTVDQLTYVSAVQRLLVQLDETEATFDEFWQQQHARLTQCLQLQRFEAQFKDILCELKCRLQEAEALPSVASTTQQAQDRLDNTHRFNDSVRNVLQRAADVRSSGQHLIACQHYAVDSINPKCGELAKRKQELEDLVALKCKTLERCFALHQAADRASAWCSEGAELLAATQLERCSGLEAAAHSLRRLDKLCAVAPHAHLARTTDLFSEYEDVILPDTRVILQQIVKSVEDVTLLCEQRKSALKKLSVQLSRPPPVASAGGVSVSPDHGRSIHFQTHQKPLMRNGSEGSLMHNGAHPGVMADTLSLGGRLSDDSSPCVMEGNGAGKGKRSLVLKELLDTEKIYVSELCSVLRGYKDDMMNPDMQHLIPIQLYGRSDILFGNLEQIYLFHNDVFLRDLENCIDTPELIGLCFVQRKESFHHLYSLYCQNKPASEDLRRQVGDNNLFFSECQRRLQHKLPLGAYLLKPVQRITKYQLLLKDLLQCVEGNDGRDALQEGVDTMLAVLKCLNDSMHQVAITAFPGSLTELGKLLMQGPFSVWVENKRVLRELRIKPAQRHLFLYEKALLFTKKTGKDNDKASYQFKCALKMSQVGLTESVRGNKGDMRKFEVWLQGRQEVYTILAPSLDVKDLWVKEIKRVLLEQFEYLKGENIKQYSARMHKGSSLNGVRPPQSPTAQHRALRQTASWEVSVLSNGAALPSSNSNLDAGVGLGPMMSMTGVKTGRAGSRTSLVSGLDVTEERLTQDEDDHNWSSEYSASEEEDDHEIFSGGHEMSSKFLVLADYTAMGPSEVSLREGDLVELVKVGCAGWWYVRVCSVLYEGWAPAAYLERVLKKAKGSTPSVSSQESSSGLHHATSRTSVASLSSKSEDAACEKWTA
ncbi:guanine nucleotide exchange factor DBS isoform X2 [Hyalella azteca]|uniref:Guanine nucleotide exchange factor DBS isoform X2 n=1 Tax=Hyalella azteca TaxID=294128 RepID=A0A979FLS4_HYAAZ|nr:guanine nucleotide exchange factor DBS isoform X2 [Hyalella azteca]